eukprot:151907-Hanusia_phi.AAC.1
MIAPYTTNHALRLTDSPGSSLSQRGSSTCATVTARRCAMLTPGTRAVLQTRREPGQGHEGRPVARWCVARSEQVPSSTPVWELRKFNRDG